MVDLSEEQKRFREEMAAAAAARGQFLDANAAVHAPGGARDQYRNQMDDAWVQNRLIDVGRGRRLEDNETEAAKTPWTPPTVQPADPYQYPQNKIGEFLFGKKGEAEAVTPGFLEREMAYQVGMPEGRKQELEEAKAAGNLMERPDWGFYARNKAGEARLALPKWLELIPAVGRMAFGPRAVLAGTQAARAAPAAPALETAQKAQGLGWPLRYGPHPITGKPTQTLDDLYEGIQIKHPDSPTGNRTFEEAYRGQDPATYTDPVTGRLTHTREGVPIPESATVVGFGEVGGEAKALPYERALEINKKISGHDPLVVPDQPFFHGGEAMKGVAGSMSPAFPGKAAGPMKLNMELHPDRLRTTFDHEFGHELGLSGLGKIDPAGGGPRYGRIVNHPLWEGMGETAPSSTNWDEAGLNKSPARQAAIFDRTDAFEGVTGPKHPLYDDLIDNFKAGNRDLQGNPEHPLDRGYQPYQVSGETEAEAFRAYNNNPAGFDKNFPRLAEAIRRGVNLDPELSKDIIFNAKIGRGRLAATMAEAYRRSKLRKGGDPTVERFSFDDLEPEAGISPQKQHSERVMALADKKTPEEKAAFVKEDAKFNLAEDNYKLQREGIEPISTTLESRRKIAKTMTPPKDSQPPPPIGHNQPPPEAKFSQWKDEYPPYGGHTWEIKTPFTKDKAVKAELEKVPQEQRALDEKHFFPSKKLSPEGAALDKERGKIQKDINAGKYIPYFDVSKRADVDPANYPAPPVDTAEIKPGPRFQKNWTDKLVDNPEAMSRLRAAYEAGKKLPNAKNWYFMKQLEDKFVKEYGDVEGRSRFADKFAGSMAATTGGASPDSNWLMAHFINYLGNKGKDLPKQSYETPVGVGGRYGVKSWTPGPYGRDNPKRLNFQYNFLGHKNKATMDEQMSEGLMPGTSVPPAGTYGHFEEAAIKLAKELGVDPRELQEVAWAGFKATSGKKGAEKYKGEPMIQTLNESIERTAKPTGRTPDEVVRLGIVRGEIPMYSTVPPGAATGLLGDAERERAEELIGLRLSPADRRRAEDLISGRL